MKHKKLLMTALIVALCASTVFCALWVRQTRDHSDLEQQCQYASRLAYERFRDYQDNGSDYDYYYGVSQLVSFYDSYTYLVTETEGSTDTDCLYLNQLLGVLMDYPELTTEQVRTLVNITSELSWEISNPNAYNQIFLLYNELTR